MKHDTALCGSANHASPVTLYELHHTRAQGFSTSFTISPLKTSHARTLRHSAGRPRRVLARGVAARVRRLGARPRGDQSLDNFDVAAARREVERLALVGVRG